MATGLAEREPVYVLVDHLAADAEWFGAVARVRAGGELEWEARRYGGRRSDARSVFALWLQAAALVEEPTEVRICCAMANTGDVAVWDTDGRPPGTRRYWPDARSYGKWQRGAEMLAARGLPRCARCRAVRASGGQGPYCSPCGREMTAGQRKFDATAGYALLDAVCGLVLGLTPRAQRERERWSARPGR